METTGWLLFFTRESALAVGGEVYLLQSDSKVEVFNWGHDLVTVFNISLIFHMAVYLSIYIIPNGLILI